MEAERRDSVKYWRQARYSGSPEINISFLKNHYFFFIPGFCEISQEDQISLIKQGSFEVILIRYTKLFRDDSMFVPDMTILVPKYENHLNLPFHSLFPEVVVLLLRKTCDLH